MSADPRDKFLLWVYLLLFLACAGGAVGLFFDGVRPQAVITVGATVAVFMMVAGPDSWLTMSIDDRTWANLALVVAAAVAVELVIAGGLALLHAPWRTTGIWLLAAGGALTVLTVLVVVLSPAWRERSRTPVAASLPAAVPSPTTTDPPVAATGPPASGRPKTGEPAVDDELASLDTKVGYVTIFFVVFGLVCAFVPAWRTGTSIVLVAGVWLLWWAACGWLVLWCWRQRSTGGSRLRTALGVLVASVASLAALAAAVLPVAAAGGFNLPPVRQLATQTGPPPGGWWGGVITGTAGFLVLMIIKMVTAPPAAPLPAAPAPPPAAPTVAPPAAYPGPSVVELTFTPMAERAVRLALAELPAGQHLTTGRLLSALVSVDIRVGWERIWLHTGGFDRKRLTAAPDLPDDGGTLLVWRGVPVSQRLADSFRLAQRVHDRYRLDVPAGSTGVLTLALVARRGNGATDTLLAGGGLTHADLLWRVQDDVLRTTLEHLGNIIPAAEQ